MEVIIKPIHAGNFTKNRYLYSVDYGNKVTGVVLHIMQGSLVGTDSWFNTPNTYVSSHDGIGKNGEIHQYVDYKDTAYHAGRMNSPTWEHIKKSLWGSNLNPNYYTYGIECEGFRGETWTEKQMESIVQRTKYALGKMNLPYKREYITSHIEIAADKENLADWCDEVVKRLNPVELPTNPQFPPVSQKNIDKAIARAKEIITLLGGTTS